MAWSPQGGVAAAAWARGSPEAWFLSFGWREDKRTAMASAMDFQDPRVLGDLLLPWLGTGTLWSSGTWHLARFGRRCNSHPRGLEGGVTAQREGGGADLNSDDPGPPAGGSQSSGARVRMERSAVVGSVEGSDQRVSGESTCSDDGALLEPPPFPPKRSEETGIGLQGW